MRRRISSLLVLSLLLFTVLTLTSFAAEKPVPRAKFNPLINLAKVWSFAGANEKIVTTSQGFPLGQPVARAPLQGPGYKVGDTWYDYQRNGAMRRMIVHDTITVGTDLYLYVSGSYMDLPGPVFEFRKDWFWTWDAFNGTSPCPAGVGIQPDDEYAGYTTTQITNDARAIVTNHNNQGTGYETHAYWQQGAGVCNFVKECRVPDDASASCQVTYPAGDGGIIWPAAAWQEGDVTVLHVLGQEAEPGAGDPQALIYARVENPEQNCVWTVRCVDTVYTLAQDVDATNDGRVILGWTANLPCSPSDPDTASGLECRQFVQLDNDVYYQISEDYGVTWQPRVNVTKHTDSCETDTAELRPYRPYVDLSVLFDSQNKWHIVWSARYWPPDANCGGDAGLLRNRIFHFSEDLVPYGLQGIRTVHNAEWDQQVCNGGAWMLNACKQTVGECNGRLYVLFTQFNDGPAGIYDDCAYENNPGYPFGSANGDLYVCVSDDWGVSWDKARNITNTRKRQSLVTPCDSVGGAGGACPSEHWSVLDRFGTNYAGSFPDNLIDLDGGGPSGWYINAQYIDDPSAGGIVQNEGHWQNADVKWFRLDCDPPITCPSINLSPSEIAYPCWLKPNTTKDVDIDVENSGNATLDYTLTVIEDVGSGWLSVTGFDGSVPSGLNNVETGTVTIDATGLSSVTYLKGRLIFDVSDPCAEDDTLPIECWVTDTLISPIWDTIYATIGTDTTCALTVANTGNFGNQGTDSVTMDFTKYDGDTCADASVYVYDGSPVVGYVKGSDTLCNFSIFSTIYLSEDGFVPIGDHTPTTDMGEYEIFESGKFVTHDSLVAVEKIWYGPKTGTPNNQFFVECIKIYVNRDTTVTGVKVGEAVDWDIPSDSGADNSSGFEPVRRLIYQQGAEYDTQNDQECENDMRFGGIDFLVGLRNDTVYKTDPFGAYTKDNATYVYPAGGFVAEELYAMMDTLPGYSLYSSVDPDSQFVDLHTVMTFDTGLVLTPGTVYKFYVSLVTSWNGDLNSFLACVDSQISWFNNYVVPGACCDTTTGDCSIKSAATCTGPNEEFQGAWTDCGPPNPCALTCCNTDGIRGDVDMSGSLNVSDVTYLVAFLKGLGPAPTCDDEADVDASGSINVSDVTYLVAYLKGIGPAPPACP